MNRLFLYGAVAAMIGMLGAAPPACAQGAPKGDTANGQKVYLADGCWQCHGPMGQGSIATGVVWFGEALPAAAWARAA